MSAWPVYVADTRGIVSSAADVLGIRMVRGMKKIGGVCEICMCLARGGVGEGGGGRVDKRIVF